MSSEVTQKKIVLGQTFPRLLAKTIHGVDISIPESEEWTHLQFRRFAGCPICNLHLQSVIARHNEIKKAGIREVVIFHSSDAELMKYQKDFPFDIIGDPTKILYKRYGVESSISAFLSLKTLAAAVRGNIRKDKPVQKGTPNGGVSGLPADFLIAPDGSVKAMHYGTHAFDQWSVDDLLILKKETRLEA